MNAEKAIFSADALRFSKDSSTHFKIETPRPMSFVAYVTRSEGAIFKSADSISAERWFVPGAFSFTNGTPNEGKHLAFKSGIKRQVEKGEFYRVMALRDFGAETVPPTVPVAVLLISSMQVFLRVGGDTVSVGEHRCGDETLDGAEAFDWLTQPDEAMKHDLANWIASVDWDLLFQWFRWTETDKFWSCVSTKAPSQVAEVRLAVQHLSVLVAASIANRASSSQASVCLIGDHSFYISGNSHLFPGSTLLQDDLRRVWSELAFWLFDQSGAKFRPGLWRNTHHINHWFGQLIPAKLQWNLDPPTGHEKIEALLSWKSLLKLANPSQQIQLLFNNLAVRVR